MALDPAILEAGAPTESDISVTRGDSPRIRGQVWNDDTHMAIDINGVTPTLEVYDETGDNLLFTSNGSLETPSTLGQYYFDLTTIQTNSLPFPTQTDDNTQRDLSARYAAILTSGSQRRTVAAGRILVFSSKDA